jgi:hypothetical protein
LRRKRRSNSSCPRKHNPHLPPDTAGDKDNGKTFDYICDVISGVDVNSYNDAEFFGKYSGFKEVQ